MNKFRSIMVLIVGILLVMAFQVLSATPASPVRAAVPGGPGRGAGPGGGRNSTPVDTVPRTLAPYFTPATPTAKSPDAEGFLQRWILLEPIGNSLRTNAGFTEAYVRNAFKTEYFKDQYTITPKDGDKVTVNGDELAWHAVDSASFNIKLFRFAYGLNKPIYGVTFFAYTVVDSPREMKNIRLAVGSNSASLWWLNGKEAIGLFGDRRMVMDDGVSRRLTLNKGRNTIRGAIINGPGMSDFCVRFIDENGDPVKDISVDLENAGH